MDLWNTAMEHHIVIRYVVALILLTLFSMKIRRPQWVSILFSCIVMYFAYGLRNLAFALCAVSFNLAIVQLNISILNEYMLIGVNLLILYSYKLFGKSIEPAIRFTYDISGFLMLLVIKSGYLRLGYRNRPVPEPPGADDKAEDAPRRPTANRATLMDGLEYLLYLPGILSGPTPSFIEFMDRKRPESVPFPTKEFIPTVACFIAYVIGREIPFQKYLLAKDCPFILRILFLYLENFSLRLKFHFIWSLAHCAFILHGFPELRNINFSKVEFCESVREISSNWNMFVSRWLKELFFTKLKNRSIAAAVLITHLMSACLHGFNVCYFLFSLSFGIFSGTITRANRLIPFKPLRQLQMVLFVSFFSMPFYLLDIYKTLEIWKAVHFMGILYCGGLMICFALYDAVRMVWKSR